jgi:hypothetical protein
MITIGPILSFVRFDTSVDTGRSHMVLIQSDGTVRLMSIPIAPSGLHFESAGRLEIVRHGAKARKSQYRTRHVAQYQRVYSAYNLYELQLELLGIELIYFLLRVELTRYEGCHVVV